MERAPSRRNASTEEELMENDPKLPQELVEEIFTRLPYKSLARFKSACKNWHALLNDPLFLSRHTSNFIKHHSGGDDSVLLKLSFPTIFGNGFESYKLFSMSAMDADPSAVHILTPKFYMLSNEFHIAGHCNGVLCLSTTYWPRSKEVLLYNPATREFRCLPDSEIRLKNTALALAVGMGYDPFTDDYKVIRIWKVDEDINGLITTNYWAEEYALSTDTWARLHDTDAISFHFGNDCFAMFFKGTYYWWAFTRVFKSSIILAFSMEYEVFQRVPIPLSIDISDPNGRSLAVWNNSISLICRTYHGENTSIDIWMMHGSGAECSWIKMWSLRHPGEAPKPLVFWRDNELLMEMSSGKIKSFDVDTQEIKVMIKGHPIQHSSQAVNYEASTVSLRGGGNYLI